MRKGRPNRKRFKLQFLLPASSRQPFVPPYDYRVWSRSFFVFDSPPIPQGSSVPSGGTIVYRWIASHLYATVAGTTEARCMPSGERTVDRLTLRARTPRANWCVGSWPYSIRVRNVSFLSWAMHVEFYKSLGSFTSTRSPIR